MHFFFFCKLQRKILDKINRFSYMYRFKNQHGAKDFVNGKKHKFHC